jgi:hypothetical protein
MTRHKPASLGDELLAGNAILEPAEQRAPASEPSFGRFLTAKEASAYLWEQYRLQRSERRLAQLRAAPVGAGSPFHRDGCAVRYRRESLDAWAAKQLGCEHGSTSAEAAFHQQRQPV